MENPFRASLLASSGSSNPWHSLACRFITPISTFVSAWLSPVFLYELYLLFFLIRTLSTGFSTHPKPRTISP